MEVFIVDSIDIKDRIDPLNFRVLMEIKNNIINKGKFKIDKIGNVCNIERGRFSFRPRNEPRFYGGKYPFIQTGDIVKASKLNDKIKYSQTLNDLGLGVSKLFNPPQLLFTIAANIGDTAILDYTACFPDSIVSVIPKNKDINIEYLNVYFKLVKKYTSELAPFAAQRNLNNKQLGDFPVIIPPMEIQKQIIQIMDEAYTKKKQNEEEAERLLNSIDDVVCWHLGIEIVDYKTEKFTIIDSNEIENRLDPLFYISGRLDFIVGEMNLAQLGNVCEYFKSGFAAGKHSQAKDSSGIIQIRPTNIDNKGWLYFDKNIYIDTSEKETRAVDLIVKGEVLFNNTNSQELVGKSAFFNLDGDYFCSNHITRIKTKQEQLLPEYLWIILNLYQRHGYFYRICTNWNNQSGVNTNLLQSVKIPLPDLEIQKLLIEEIEKLFYQSKKLIYESNHIIHQAKKEIEKILFE